MTLKSSMSSGAAGRLPRRKWVSAVPESDQTANATGVGVVPNEAAFIDIRGVSLTYVGVDGTETTALSNASLAIRAARARSCCSAHPVRARSAADAQGSTVASS